MLPADFLQLSAFPEVFLGRRNWFEYLEDIVDVVHRLMGNISGRWMVGLDLRGSFLTLVIP